MRGFAPEPGDTVDVTLLRPLAGVSWGAPRHRAPWRSDPLGLASTLLVAVGSVMVFCSLVGLVLIGLYKIAL